MIASSSLRSRSPLRGCLRQGLTALPLTYAPPTQFCSEVRHRLVPSCSSGVTNRGTHTPRSSVLGKMSEDVPRRGIARRG